MVGVGLAGTVCTGAPEEDQNQGRHLKTPCARMRRRPCGLLQWFPPRNFVFSGPSRWSVAQSDKLGFAKPPACQQLTPQPEHTRLELITQAL